MSYEADIQTTLYNDAILQGLLASWVYSSETFYAVFNSNVIPNNLQSDSGAVNLDVKDSTINHYQTGTIDGGKRVIDTTHSLSCRASTYTKAKDLANAAKEALNRNRVNDSFFVCSLLSVIPPADETDNFNAPVEVKILNKQ
jgi:hypothetical protein